MNRIIVFFLFFFANIQGGVEAATFTPVPDTTLVIRDGSPLDFSRWLPTGTAGDNGRIVAGPQGRMVFASNPNIPARLNCVSMAISGVTGGFPADKATADAFAHQIKAHGYNLVRFHYIEATLMTGRMNDFDFDPVLLDRFYYFLFALKREGVYWLFDAMSSENGAYGNVVPHRWIQQYNLKFLVQVDEAARAHWRMLVDKLYFPPNPYTGISLLADPALVGVTMLNEGGMNYLALTREGGWRSELQTPFNSWVKRKYSTNSALAAAWGDLRLDESLTGTLRMPENLRTYSPRMNDFQRFLTELETDTARMMMAHLRLRGYSGLTTAYDNWVTTQADATRSALEWIDMHSYHDESLSFEPGAKLLQTSSLANLGRYARWLAVSRQAGKPFSVTEFGQPFWNKYRFEAALVVPSMAAFQGWDFICQHGEGGIDLSLYQSAQRKKALFPYGIGMDPITRAGETVSAILFMRGDVIPSPHRISVQFPYEVAFNQYLYLDAVPDDLSMMSWITGIETVYPNKSSTFPSPYVTQPVSPGVLALGVVKTPAQLAMGYYELGASIRIDNLKRAGLIPSGNLSDVTAGIYQSDTNQLLLDRTNGRFMVKTAKTEALSSDKALSNINLNRLKIQWLNTAGLLAVSTLDDVPLADSKNMLIVYATDAENTGMAFADTERKILSVLGTVPPRLQVANARMTLSLSHATPMKLTALSLNGERTAEVPMLQIGNDWTFTLDTAKNPTTFFVLEAR